MNKMAKLFFVVQSEADTCLLREPAALFGTGALGVLYAGADGGKARQWRRTCVAIGCSFAALSAMQPEAPPYYGYEHEITSLRVFQHLRQTLLRGVYFEDALAFHCLQARKTLGEFSGTCFITRAGTSEARSANPLEATRQAFCRNYCLRHADSVLRLGDEPSAEGQSSIPGFSSAAPWQALRAGTLAPASSNCLVSAGKVSVCMAHYNHPRYLPLALESLARQDHENFEVIVTDDGSTDAAALHVFEEQKRTRDARFRFYHKKNSGPGDTRNFCAAHADGDYLVFMDADNLARPSMVRVFAESMARSNMDALTCHFEAFSHESCDLAPKNARYRSVPIGQDIVTGLLENTFGDTNMIVRTDVFRQMHGMCATRTGVEDWEFLVRLALTGHTQDVIPEPLFYYRLTPEGLSRNNARLDRQGCILAAYENYGIRDVLARRMVEDLAIPFHRFNNRIGLAAHSVFLQPALRAACFLERLYQKLCPAASRRQRFATTCRRFFQRSL